MSEVGRIGPAGYPLVVGIEGGAVTIGSLTAWWTLDAQQRDDFTRLYFEAIRQAEGDAGLPPRVAAAAVPGCIDPPCTGECEAGDA